MWLSVAQMCLQRTSSHGNGFEDSLFLSEINVFSRKTRLFLIVTVLVVFFSSGHQNTVQNMITCKSGTISPEQNFIRKSEWKGRGLKSFNFLTFELLSHTVFWQYANHFPFIIGYKGAFQNNYGHYMKENPTVY